MGKDKEQKLEAPGSAFTRMNYLYQAAHLMTDLYPGNPLGNYYNKVMKEISKKIVEKLHPDLKRTVCMACNHPLTARSNDIFVKLKTHRKKGKRKKARSADNKVNCEKGDVETRTISNNCVDKYSKCRVEVRNKRPNKILWSCSRCNFTKGYVQQPSYKLWIHKIQDDS